MVKKCCAFNCTNTRKDAILYKFPINEHRRKQWFSCLGLQSSAALRFVCQKHFEKRFIGPHSRLLNNAYPSLFSVTEITSGSPDNNSDDYDPHMHEHSYARKRKHDDHNYYIRNSSCPVDSPSLVREEVPSTSGNTEKSSNLLEVQKTSPAVDSPSLVREEVPSTSGNTEKSSNLVEVQKTSSAVESPSLARNKCLTSGNTEKSSTSVEVEMASPTESSTRKSRVTAPTGKTVSRKRIINKLAKLTPTARKIYKEFQKSRSQTNFLSRAKRALKFSKDTSFEKLTQDMNPYAKKFVAMQIKLCKSKKKGRRFSLDEKLIALAIMKQGPRCYRFLHRIFVLPSPTTLNKLVTKIDLEAGINPKLFKLMTKQVSTWKEEKKYCSIIFDEMALGMGVSYNNKEDRLSGFVDLNERKNRFADHVLVFMLRGAVYKWQQPVAYHFCEGATSGAELKTIIKNVVEAVSQTGLKPIVLGCDQGSAFQSAIHSLQTDTRRNKLMQNKEPDDSIVIGENKMNVIYDPSHLIKGIRNNFLNKNIALNGKISRWQDIVDVYETDCNHMESRLLHKLNDEHVIPEKIKKMKVKNCVRVLSKTVAAALSYTSQFSHYVDGRPVSATIKNTAETVSFFDDLFDSINGASLNLKDNKGKVLRSAVHDKSKHHEFWPEAIKKLEKMSFIDANGKEKYVPTIKNFITTIKTYMKLWQLLKSINVKIMRPRYFNTDPIENFFGQVRAYNYRNNNPTCHNFTNTFKALTITRVLNFHSESYNCEDDPAEPIIYLKSLFDENETASSNTVSEVVRSGHLNEIVINTTNVVEQARRERLNTHSRAYVTGWVVKKYLDKIPCRECKQQLTSSPNTTHQWITQREYEICKKSQKLFYPSEKAVRFFGIIQNETNEYLEINAHKKNIKTNLKEIFFSKYSFDLVNCPEHESFCFKYLMEISMKFAIYNWCNVINKILKGVDVARLKGRCLPYYQALALNKYEKKLNKFKK